MTFLRNNIMMKRMPCCSVVLVAIFHVSMLAAASCGRDPARAAGQPGSKTQTLILVEKGKASNSALELGKKWERKEGFLECGGAYNYLCCVNGMGPGDFRIHARLSMAELDGTAACFFLNMDNFGFDGRKGRFFLQGAEFGRTRFIGDSSEHITATEPFDLELTRKKTTLEFHINGKKICEQEYHDAPIGWYGLCPWRGVMRVYDFSVSCAIREPPPLKEVFVSGSDGYHTYRIPSLLYTDKGTLLAFCEGRKNGRGDTGDIDLLVKRSEDIGKSWSRQETVWDDGVNVCGNPCPVQDRDTGVIWLFMTWNRGDDSEHDIISGSSTDTRRVFKTSSADDGKTWAEPEEITEAVKKPDWSWYATGPGVGVQLEHDPHKGRMLVPCDHKRSGDEVSYHSHVFFSDDHGVSWKLGAATQNGSNECQVIERSDGTLLLNMRRARNVKEPLRMVASGGSGGEFWSKTGFDMALADPRCQASIINTSTPTSSGNRAVLFSNVCNTSRRAGLVVRMSLDEGLSWPFSMVLHPGPAAYSCLAGLPNANAACLFEYGNEHPYEKIVLAAFPLDRFVPREKIKTEKQ